MSTYLEKVEAAKKGIDNFYKLLNIYKYSKTNQGWVGSENSISDIYAFDSYLWDMSSLNTSDDRNVTLFDIPMNSYGFDKYGRYGAGIPSDIGFCRNIKSEKRTEFEIYNVSGMANYKWTAVCYGDGKYVALSSAIYNDDESVDAHEFYSAFSYNGIHWVVYKKHSFNIPDPDEQCWNAICYGNGKFIAVGDGGLFAYSTDGFNWSIHNYTTIEPLNDICYGNGKFVVVKHAEILYSTDGLTWNNAAENDAENTYNNVTINAICYGNGKFVCILLDAENDNKYGNMYSTDGIYWHYGDLYKTNTIYHSICYGNGKYIAVGNMHFAYSTNGITWYTLTLSDNSRTWRDVCYGNGKFIILPADSGTALCSTDGINWTEISLSDTEMELLSICYGNGKFVAVGNGDKIAYYDPNNKISLHEPLYQVTGASTVDYLASPNATTVYGGKIRATMIDGNALTIYPNGSTDGIEVYPIEESQNTIWSNSYKYMITTVPGAAHLHNLFCFVSVDKNNGGFILYITPNFINWNIHTIIPDDANAIAWHNLTGSIKERYADRSYAFNIQSILKKYFRVLPNNNYLIFYPLPMYDGEDKTTMATLYSPWQNEPLMTIKDPYDSIEDYAHKAVNGISAYLTENGEEILYYNNRPEMPLVLHYGRSMGTFTSEVYENYNHEIVESPKIAKVYGKPQITDDKVYFQKSIPGLSIDLAINIVESRNGRLTDEDIPAASVGLAIGDVADKIYDNDDDEFKHYNQLELFIDKKIDMMDNIDVDFNEYLITNGIPGEKIIEGDDPKDMIYKGTEGFISDVSRKWTSVCYGNDKFVAIARDSNYFAYSYDGITWKESYATSELNYWRTVCYGNGIFVAADYNGSAFLYSYNGIHWVESSLAIEGGKWRPLCYGNGKFVAASSNSNMFACSSDGDIWIQTAVGEIDRYWKSMCFGNGKFIALAEGTTFARSSDGINWEEITVTDDAERSWNSICYGDGKFVAIVSHSNIVAYSTDDGDTWTETIVSDTDRYWYSICYGNGIFVAIANNTNIFAYSSDGITWIEGHITEAARGWYSICYGNGKFVAVAINDLKYAYYDALKLSSVPIPIAVNESILEIAAAPTTYRKNARYRATVFGNSLYSDIVKVVNNPSIITESFTWEESNVGVSKTWYDICYGNGMYIAIAYQNFVYSYNGIEWTKITVTKNVSRSWKSICYADGKFVAVSTTNYFVYSTDGINWTQSTISATSRTWQHICYGNGIYVAITSNHKTTATSTDGINWTEHSPIITGSSDKTWYSLCFGNGKFVAVSIKYAVCSTDGINWTQYAISNTVRTWYDVCYGNGKFVAVAYNGYYAYSTDGITWIEDNTGNTTRDWSGVCYGNDRFTIISTDGHFAYSTDGITWIDGIASESDNEWSDICYGNGKFIAISSSDTFISSIITSTKY